MAASNLEQTKKQIVEKEFAHLKSLYFNSAYFGPGPIRAKTLTELALSKELDPSFFQYEDWFSLPERMRVTLARLIDCPAHHITHTTSVSETNSIIANGLKLRPGDAVCTLAREYPSNVIPWMLSSEQRGHEFHLLDLPMPTPQLLSQHLPKNTKVFIASHVAFDSGRKIDLISLGKFLQDRDILFVVDATQSLGGLAITAEELKYIDVLACSAYKWLLGPYGTSFAYYSSKALEKVKHTHGNWIVSPNSKVVYSLLDYTTQTLPGAIKYDRGQTPNMLSMACLQGAVEFLLDIGLTSIQQYNEQIRDYFLGLYPQNKYQLITPAEAMGNIVCLKATTKDSVQLAKDLREHNIDVSVREGNIRLSFHIFNTQEQIDQLVKVLDK